MTDVHVEVQGSLSIGGPPVQRDSLFRIASTTKPITGAVTMALVDDGRLALDEPVTRLLPELASPQVLRRMDGPLDDTVPAAREITVRDLLTFTFGFGMHIGMFMAADAVADRDSRRRRRSCRRSARRIRTMAPTAGRVDQAARERCR